jgi:hypothetical protein
MSPLSSSPLSWNSRNPLHNIINGFRHLEASLSDVEQFSELQNYLEFDFAVVGIKTRIESCPGNHGKLYFTDSQGYKINVPLGAKVMDVKAQKDLLSVNGVFSIVVGGYYEVMYNDVVVHTIGTRRETYFS